MAIVHTYDCVPEFDFDGFVMLSTVFENFLCYRQHFHAATEQGIVLEFLSHSDLTFPVVLFGF
jgi:hypothetical protein